MMYKGFEIVFLVPSHLYTRWQNLVPSGAEPGRAEGLH